jgi:5'-3' exonuclease
MPNQPIKKNILASDYYKNNPYVDHEETEYILIIDGTGLLKGSIVDSPYNSNGIRTGWIKNYMWKIRHLLQKRPFSKIFCAWDGQNSGLLRYDLYPDYKKNRDKNYSEYDRQMQIYVHNVLERQKKKDEKLAKAKDKEKYLSRLDVEKQQNEDFQKCKMLLHELLEDLFFRQIQDNAEGTESDDIIAYIVLNKLPNQKIYIITGDSDLHQLISEDVAVYNPKKKEFYHTANYMEKREIPLENILVEKVFIGDSSDSISGVKGLGEKNMKNYYPELYSEPVTIEKIVEKTKLLLLEKPKIRVLNKIIEEYENGDIELRRKIINLKEPILGKEIKFELDELMESPLDPNDRNFENVYKILSREEMTEINNTSFFIPFKRVIEKERHFYKNSGYTIIN